MCRKEAYEMKIKITTKNQGEFSYMASGMDIMIQTKTVLIYDKNNAYGFHLDDVEKIEVEENA